MAGSVAASSANNATACVVVRLQFTGPRACGDDWEKSNVSRSPANFGAHMDANRPIHVGAVVVEEALHLGHAVGMSCNSAATRSAVRSRISRMIPAIVSVPYSWHNAARACDTEARAADLRPKIA